MGSRIFIERIALQASDYLWDYYFGVSYGEYGFSHLTSSCQSVVSELLAEQLSLLYGSISRYHICVATNALRQDSYATLEDSIVLAACLRDNSSIRQRGDR
ncbi:hypothetical protein PR202_gb13409 [Eleusine coracana subsp. coracana]|uniref:Uncharacterized protein n=1 Tax=Eleusine coracana subsp. coracana TaxID=191504 RepID=A0AAV5ESS1_ELECO|nr:hypothetical protein PR202_gb13409 [Eleusine coracana subsp. coracana]